MKLNLTKGALLSVALIFPASWVAAQDSQYEIVGQKSIRGQTYYSVHNTASSDSGHAYGVLDPKGNFYACGSKPCSTADIKDVHNGNKSVTYVPKSSSSSSSFGGGDEERGGGGGGGGGGGM